MTNIQCCINYVLNVIKNKIKSQTIILWSILTIIIVFFTNSILSSNISSFSILLISPFALLLFIDKNRYYGYFTLFIIPYLYTASILLYNANLWQSSYQSFAFIKMAYISLPGILSLFIIKKSKFDFYVLIYLAFLVVHFFIGESKTSEKVGALQELVLFISIIYFGRFLYSQKYAAKSIECNYIINSIIIASIGFLMLLLPSYEENILRPFFPKRYLILSTGMKEYEFLGNYPASAYSFIFHDSLGTIRRNISLFNSGIGLSYFLFPCFIISIIRKRKKLSVFLLTSIVFTYTRAIYIMIIIVPAILYLLLKPGKKKFKFLIVISAIFLSILYLKDYLSLIVTYLRAGNIDISKIPESMQSGFVHLASIANIVLLFPKSLVIGSGIGNGVGESFLIDMISQIGFIGFTVFLLIALHILSTIKNKYLIFKNKSELIALSFIIFNIIGGLFSRENYIFNDSYMTWCYIGMIYQKSISKDEYANLS